MKARRACELCNGEAALHCASDSAFLCWACDAHVHGANFLVARHPRRLLCPECGSFDDDDDDLPVLGPGFLPFPSLCRSCHHGDSSSFSDSESSACSSSSLPSSMSYSCVSSAESGAAACTGEGRGLGIAAVPADGHGPIKAACSANSATDSDCSNPGRATRRRRPGRRAAAARAELDARAEVVLTSWCRRLGLESGCAVGAASHALTAATRRMAAVPFRLSAASAVWFAAKSCCAEAAAGGRRATALLRRLEACSGVPAKLIVVAEARVSRAVRRCHVSKDGEGWAECSS